MIKASIFQLKLIPDMFKVYCCVVIDQIIKIIIVLLPIPRSGL